MSTAGLIIGIGLAGLVGLAILAPLLEGGPEVRRDGPRGTSRQNRALETLHAEKMRVLRSIRDLDFDYDMGKLPDDAYAAQRIALIRLGVAILRRIDALEDDVRAQQARIEAAVAAVRQTGRAR